MGTSASSAGLKGKTPLLPNWATGPADNNIGVDDTEDDNTDNDDGNSDADPETNDDKPDTKIPRPAASLVETNNWRTAKSAIKNYINNRTKENLKKSGKSYVQTYGGAKSATKASLKGIDYGFAFASFLGGFAQKGYEQNLMQHGLSDCIGKSSEEVLARIADRIAPIGSTNDDAIARGAIMDSLDKLYEKIITAGGDIESLGVLDETALKEAVIEFTSNYIFKKWVYELGLVLEKNELSEKTVIQLENEIKVFIKSEVQIALKDKDVKVLDLNDGEGRKIIENIFELAYLTIEK